MALQSSQSLLRSRMEGQWAHPRKTGYGSLGHPRVFPPKKELQNMPTATASSYLTKSEVFRSLSDSTGLSKQQITTVFENLSQLIETNIGKKGPGIFVIPGLAKIKVIRKPATKEREGINPFTGEQTIFKAKPARNVIKIQPLKALKDMV
jgi:nucleoid DNA-binding protein